MRIKLSVCIFFLCGLPLLLSLAGHAQASSATPDDSKGAIQHVIVAQ